jgi:hypothetical protein
MKYDIADNATDNYNFEDMALRFKEASEATKPSGYGKKPRQRAPRRTRGMTPSAAHQAVTPSPPPSSRHVCHPEMQALYVQGHPPGVQSACRRARQRH